MVDWKSALRDCKLFHTSGISFGLSYHSKYENNPLLEAFNEAMSFRPADCLVGNGLQLPRNPLECRAVPQHSDTLNQGTHRCAHYND